MIASRATLWQSGYNPRDIAASGIVRKPSGEKIPDEQSMFGEVVDSAINDGPQIIESRGKKAAVLISFDDFKNLTPKKESLVEFLINSPLRGADIDFERDKSLPREIEL